MKKENRVAGFVHDKRGMIGLWTGSLFFIVLIIWLNHVPMYSIRYIMLLYIAAGIVVSVASYRKYCRNCMERQRILQEPALNIPEDLSRYPLAEQEYMNSIREIYAAHRREQSLLVQKEQERENYIRLWVHQIKTPMTAMRLLVQDEKQLDRKEIEKELFEIEKYLDTMLQYIRLDSLNADLQLESCSLEELVQSSVRYFSRSFIQKKLTVQLDGLDIRVKTDPKWLLFALNQIVSNSLKYTRQGGIKFFGYRDETAQQIYLVIEDTGCGIDPQDLPRIFEQSFTGYNGHMDRKATGIGLYLTHQILDRLGHTIRITSEVGQGTRVLIGFSDWNANLTEM